MASSPSSASPEAAFPFTGHDPERTVVLAALEKVLISACFRASPQLSRFLRYVVENTAQGEGDQLKEYRLGIEVMGRPSSYDPRKDPIVRLEARRLRAKLREYYENEGSQDSIRIDIPKGGYAAVFSAAPRAEQKTGGPELGVSILTEAAGQSPLSPTQAPAQRSGRSRRARVGIAAAALFILLVAAWGIHRMWSARGGGPGELESIVILPLQNGTGDPAEDYLVDGITDELINSLSRLPGLKVIAHSTAFRFKGDPSSREQIGRNLHASAVLSGSLLERGDTLIAQADLIDVASGRKLWSGQYNRKLTAIPSMQEEFAHEIAIAIRPRLTGDAAAHLTGRPAQTTEAYLLYLKGRYSWNKRTEAGFTAAIDYFNQAIASDPSYAPAYTGIADGYMLLAEYLALPADVAFPKAREAALKALELDQNLSEAHASLGAISADQWQWAEAGKELRRAIELNPGYATAHQWYAELLAEQGRSSDAMAEIRAAQEIDPLSPIINSQAARVMLLAGENDAAIEQLRKIQDTDPGFGVADYYLGKAYLRKHSSQQAIAELQKATREARISEWDALLGYAYAQAGNAGAARQILNRYVQSSKETYVSWYGVAVLYAGLGDNDHALASLEAAYRQHDPRLRELKVDPFLENLRGNQRFTDLVLRLGI